MFSIYGIQGPVFQGTLENLSRMPPVSATSATRRTRAIQPENEPIDEAELQSLSAQATRAYQSMRSEELERGPLYYANQIMQHSVITVRDRDTVEQALQTLISNQIHQAPVLDTEYRLAGIVSDRDLLRALHVDHDKTSETLLKKVADVMTTPVVAASPQTDIRRIARAMLEQGVEGIPIVNESGNLIGFISRTDILGAVVTDPPLRTWR